MPPFAYQINSIRGYLALHVNCFRLCGAALLSFTIEAKGSSIFFPTLAESSEGAHIYRLGCHEISICKSGIVILAFPIAMLLLGVKRLQPGTQCDLEICKDVGLWICDGTNCFVDIVYVCMYVFCLYPEDEASNV